MTTGRESGWPSGLEGRPRREGFTAFSGAGGTYGRGSVVQAFDGSNDPEVCCARCGRYLGKDSRFWWDDYTCEYCHEARAA
ncbi:MAG TPA: hypothetical protein VF889_05775 [Bacteroidota bacterium]